MLSRPQQILLKRAQREAGLDDSDYRDALETVSGCRTSKDPELTDRHLDKVLAYLEAIHWRNVDRGALQPSCSANAVFRRRGYWASKNTGQQTSRDRYAGTNKSQAIAGMETALAQLGFGPGYVAAIRQNVTQGRTDDRAQYLYLAALQRTLRAKQKDLVSPG
ncbi:MAG TPA: hypothetical protein VFZ59_01720 [Verrucomicrobiae bacterium]|nr:hypothetical protein [Verrucomicrobiae bacterium]